MTIMVAKGNALFDRYRRWRRYRTTVSALEKLETRELDDLGIARGNIDRIARQSVL